MKRYSIILFFFILLNVCVFASDLKGISLNFYAPEAKEVKVAMDLFDWDPNKIVLEKEEDGNFKKYIKLPVGEYRFKFVVDGVWRLSDKFETVKEDGYTNHVLRVGDPSEISDKLRRNENRLKKRRAVAKKYGNLSSEMYRLYDKFKFAIMGDMHNDRELLKTAVEFINSEKVSFTFGVGDYVKKGSDIEEWIDFLSVVSSLKEPFVPALGEREYVGDKEAENIRYLMRLKDDKTYYSFSFENKKFITTDSNQEIPGSFFSKRQSSWLENELSDTSVNGKFIIGYRPYFIKGSMPRYKDSWAKYSYERNRLHSLYKKNDVLGVISGCEETFQYKRVDMIDYIVCPQEYIMIVDVSDSMILYRIFSIDRKMKKVIHVETIKREVG